MSFVLELDKPAAEALEELEAITGMNACRIFGYALSLMLWVAKQGQAGRTVASMDESRGSYRELETDVLREKRSQAA